MLGEVIVIIYFNTFRIVFFFTKYSGSNFSMRLILNLSVPSSVRVIVLIFSVLFISFKLDPNFFNPTESIRFIKIFV